MDVKVNHPTRIEGGSLELLYRQLPHIVVTDRTGHSIEYNGAPARKMMDLARKSPEQLVITVEEDMKKGTAEIAAHLR